MDKYFVTYVVRKRGSLGNPHKESVTVEAENRDQAKDKARAHFQEEGFETFYSPFYERLVDN
jgi:1,2-phenylacetyl-CoA epoxidase PaaB subunit